MTETPPILDAVPPDSEPGVRDRLYAMYTSWWQGIVTDPALMMVPVDDHLVHRGDGVFETLKCLQGRVFAAVEHIDRLLHSAEAINLPHDLTHDRLLGLMAAVVQAGGRKDCLLRILLSRGRGGMGISPSECPRYGLVIVAYRLPPPFMESHPEGATACTSELGVKPGFYATIKSCNYLSNALLKREAEQKGVHFAFTFDETGHLAEGATENAGIVTGDGILMIPRPARILPGTTMRRVFTLAGEAVRDGTLAGKLEGDITRDALIGASEMLVFGTTANVTAVTVLDGRPVGEGRPGPVYRRLSELFLEDLHRKDGPMQTTLVPGHGA